MKRILICWIGNTDLDAAKGDKDVGAGPIAQALEARAFDEVCLITDYPKARVVPYLDWLQNRTETPHHLFCEKLSGPTQFGEIYEAAVRVCTAAKEAAELVGLPSPQTFTNWGKKHGVKIK